MAKPVFIIGERAGVWTYGDDGELRLATAEEEAAADAANAFDVMAESEVSPAKLGTSYTVLVTDTLAGLIESVNDLMHAGWQPLDSPFYVFAADSDSQGWHQAMIYME